jgi:hypothetical protein
MMWKMTLTSISTCARGTFGQRDRTAPRRAASLAMTLSSVGHSLTGVSKTMNCLVTR